MTTRIFLSRLAGLDVFDPLGDPVGRVRDAVVTFGAPRSKPKVIGLLLEVPGRKRVFMPMTREGRAGTERNGIGAPTARGA